MDCCSLLAKGLITCESPEDNSRLLGEVQRAAWCVHEGAAEIAAFRCWREKPVGVASALHKQQPVCHLLTLQLCLCSTQGFTCLKHRAALSLWGQMIKLLQLHVLYLVDPKAEWCCSSELTHTDSSHAFKKIKKEKKNTFHQLQPGNRRVPTPGGLCMVFGDQKHGRTANGGMYKVADLFSKVWTRHPAAWLKILSKLS